MPAPRVWKALLKTLAKSTETQVDLVRATAGELRQLRLRPEPRAGDPPARRAAAPATGRGARTRPGSQGRGRRRPAGGDGAEGLPRPPCPADSSARQSLLPSPRTWPPAPGPAGEHPVAPRPSGEVIPRPSGGRRRARVRGESCTSLLRGGPEPSPGRRAGSVHGVRAGGRFESARGGRATRGRTARGETTTTSAWRQVRPEPPGATLRTPARVQDAGGSPETPRAGRRLPEKVPGPGLRPLPPAPPRPPPGPRARTHKRCFNETTPTLLAPRPSSGR